MGLEIVKVKEVVGSGYALSAGAGEAVYDRVACSIAAQRPTVLDFDGVDNATTVFLNNAVGRLYGTYEADDIRKLLSVENATDNIVALMQVAVRNAKQYFADKEAAEERDRNLVLDD